MSSLTSIYINNSYKKITELGLNKSSAKLMPQGSIIMSSRAPIGYIGINTVEACTSQGCKSLVPFILETNHFLFFAIKASVSRIIEASKGTTFNEISGTKFGEILVPLAPLNEQHKICKRIDYLYESLGKIEENIQFINVTAKTLKQKILNLFFSNNSSYKSYYEKKYELGQILEYEQPTNYIVNSLDYNLEYSTPVLTAGKTFILGYTNEKCGIYHIPKGEKVIIFDDFTTSSHLVDFDFKVKSSAMKILKIIDKKLFDVDYIYFLLQTLDIDTANHKRYWIQKYIPLQLKIHTYDEQKEIVKNIYKLYDVLDSICQS